MEIQTNKIKQTKSAIDIAKFFFCICIIALHTHVADALPAEGRYWLMALVIRQAVPFFFVASGYFLGKKLMASPKEESSKITLGYCKRLTIPLLFWEFLNLILHFVLDVHGGESMSIVLKKSLHTMFFYPYGGLWFVQACIVGAILLLPFIRYCKLNVAIVIGLLLYGFALLCNNYYFLVEGTFIQPVVDNYMTLCTTARNGLFTGFISMAVGMKCSEIEKKITGVHPLFCVLSFILFVLECYFLKDRNTIDDHALYISHLFILPTLLLLLLKSNFSLKYEISLSLRNLSVGMFFLHSLINNTLSVAVGFGIIRFIFTCIIAYGICIFCYKTHFLKLDNLLR